MTNMKRFNLKLALILVIIYATVFTGKLKLIKQQADC